MTAEETQPVCWYEPEPYRLAWLASRDEKLGEVIRALPPVRRRIYPDPFWALLRCIVGQQISAKTQEKIWNLFLAAFGNMGAAEIAALPPEAIRSCGISLRKVGYIQGIAASFASGELNGSRLAAMNDAELEKLLTALPGVGRWTVEMLLIFTFLRPNILSFGDFAIRRGLCRLHGHDKLTRKLFDYYFALYSPHATVAGFYLWAVAGGQS